MFGIRLDLIAHFLMGWLIVDVLTSVSVPTLWSIAACILIAAAKEWLYDKKRRETNTVDPRDFAATVLGGVAQALWRGVAAPALLTLI